MIQYNVDLRPYNTFGVSAAARYFVDVQTPDKFAKLMQEKIFKNTQQKCFLGGGSNLLLTSDFDGLVIHNNIQTKRIISMDDETIKVMVGGGVLRHDFVMRAAERGRRGIENLALIPGTVGAAPVQNIGAYGVEVSEVITSVKGFDLEMGGIRALNPIECHFDYRDSVFKQELKNKFFITHVTFQLSKKPHPRLSYKGLDDLQVQAGITPLDIAQKVIEIRQSKLPDRKVLGTAGSFFRNPIVTREVYEQLLSEYPDLVGWEVGKKSLHGHAREQVNLPAGYEVRRATLDDVEAINTVRQQSWKETYRQLPQDYIDQRFETKAEEDISRLIERIQAKNTSIYVATYQGSVVGVKYGPWFDEDRKMHRIGGIYMLGEHHGKGIGTALMQISLSGVSEDLLLGVAKDNQPAIAFYQGLGFVEDPSMEDDWILDNDHSIRVMWMKRIITQPTDSIKLSAAQLIELAGYPRGTRVGDVGNYDHHALVLVNYGDATGDEVWDFAQEMITAVREEFDVKLVPEVNVI